MKMEARLDTGPVMVQRALRIGHNDHAGTIHDELAKLGGICICEGLARLQTGAYDLKPQDDSLASYAKKLEKKEGEIDWNRPAEAIHNRIRAMFPWPGAFFQWTNPDGKALRLNVTPGEVSEEAAPKVAPGTILGEMDGRLAIATADKIYLTPEVKPQGKKGMDATAFVCGYLKECKQLFLAKTGESGPRVRAFFLSDRTGGHSGSLPDPGPACYLRPVCGNPRRGDFMTKQPERFLIFNNGMIGNTLFNMPAAAWLKREYPGCFVGMVVDRVGMELAGDDPNVDSFHVFNKKKDSLAVQFRLALALRRERYDVSLHLRKGVRNELLARLAGVKLRAGYRLKGEKKKKKKKKKNPQRTQQKKINTPKKTKAKQETRSN
eukprot:TRINITY_DN2633_c0_g3_i1.p1 TRINITY_DN2633_c0_g3~~TRINITY_DN2633_c0_g3_i1.p1  ORF type:complete len:378 (-),score=159.21 TRINITY_DN2633_c0_g3_i1:4-1137(-)